MTETSYFVHTPVSAKCCQAPIHSKPAVTSSTSTDTNGAGAPPRALALFPSCDAERAQKLMASRPAEARNLPKSSFTSSSLLGARSSSSSAPARPPCAARGSGACSCAAVASIATSWTVGSPASKPVAKICERGHGTPCATARASASASASSPRCSMITSSIK